MQHKIDTPRYTEFTNYDEEQILKLLDERIKRRKLILSDDLTERRKIVMRAIRRAQRAGQ